MTRLQIVHFTTVELILISHLRGNAKWPLNRISLELSKRRGRNINLLEYRYTWSIGTTVSYNAASLRWLNTVCARLTDSVSDAIKRALGLWYANTAVDKAIPQFHMKWIIKLSFDSK